MLSVRQKSTASKTVLKSYVKGLISRQEMIFLHIEIFQKIFCCYVQTMERESKLKPRINLNQLIILFEGLVINTLERLNFLCNKDAVFPDFSFFLLIFLTFLLQYFKYWKFPPISPGSILSVAF